MEFRDSNNQKTSCKSMYPALLLLSVSMLLVILSFGIPFCDGGTDDEKASTESDISQGDDPTQVIYADPEADTDADGIPDSNDNCPAVSNPDKADSDGNGIGDACQDSDNDSILDTVDNCDTAINMGQEDFDKDGIGDACDPNDDNDGINDDEDTCPYDTDPNCNPETNPDDDNDGFEDTNDNCPSMYNPDQVDSNGDGQGDVCEDDIDAMEF